MSVKGKSSCYNKAGADEPIFVLRAQDVLAPSIVREWAARASDRGASSSKVSGACACAKAMQAWQQNNHSKLPD